MEIRVGDNVKVVSEGRYQDQVGVVVRIANTGMEKFYIVEFEGGDYVYYHEEDIEYRN